MNEYASDQRPLFGTTTRLTDELPECAVESIAELATELWRSEQNRAILGRAMESYSLRVHAGRVVLAQALAAGDASIATHVVRMAYNLIATGHVEGRTSA